MPNSRLRRFDGQYRWVLDNGIPFYAPDGTFTGYIGSCIDITERRSLEQQLQYSEQKLRSLVEANILGVIVADLDGRIYESNDCFAQTLGYSTDELLAETFHWSQLIPPESHEALAQLMTPFRVGVPAQRRQSRANPGNGNAAGSGAPSRAVGDTRHFRSQSS